MDRQYFVNILSNRHHTVLYTGVMNDLVRRVFEHRNKLIAGFTKRYNVDKLVFFEATSDVRASIAREKQIKSGSRAKKIGLIEAINPQWHDLYQTLP
jgi:putative endonuclease